MLILVAESDFIKEFLSHLFQRFFLWYLLPIFSSVTPAYSLGIEYSFCIRMASMFRTLTLWCLAISALLPTSNALGTPELFARADCQDNLGRCFNPGGTASAAVASRSAATAFCSSYFAVSVVTSTRTITPTRYIAIVDPRFIS